jgi:hypothetical protein
MKKQSLTGILLILILPMLLVSTGFAQVRGDGHVVKQERSVNAFNGVNVRSGIDLTVTQGNQAGLTVETDENIQEYIISEVSNGMLEIYVRRNTNIQKATRMTAHVTVSELKQLDISGGGDVKSLNTITAGDLAITISGGGDLAFDLAADRVKCTMSGGGDASLNGRIRQLSAGLSGGGDLALKGELGMLDLNISGGGDVSVDGKGSSSGVVVGISGGGDLQLDMACEKIKTTVSGGGDVSIHAGDHVSQAGIDVTGGGDLTMELHAAECMITIGGGGDAYLSGSAEKFYGEVKSGGDIDASGFRIQAAKLDLSGGSDARIHVEKELTVNASGGSQIYLSGDPHVDANLSGGSKIHRK